MTELSAEAIQSHLADTKRRRSTAWRYFWILLVAFGVLMIVLPLATYVTWRARGQRLLREQLNAAKARNEPITTAEMTAWHAVPVGQRDITPLWLAAIALFDTPAYSTAVANVPLVGGNGGAVPPLDQPWTDPAAVRNYFDTYQRELAALHAVANEQGVVRYPREFKKGIGMLLPDAQKLRSASRALQLQFQQQLRDKNTPAALDNIDTQLALGRTLDHDPILISLLVRVAIQSGTLSNIRQAAEVLPLDDAQLAHLQTVVRQMDIQKQYEDSFIGERAMVYHSFHLPISVWSTGNAPNGQSVEVETTHDPSRVSRPEDCAMALDLLTQFIDAAKQGPPASLDATTAIDEKFRAMQANASPWERFRFAQTHLLLPAMGTAANADARFRAARDLTDVLLAIRRFELKHQRLPKELDELVPEFLSAVPLDPFDSQPVRIRLKDGTVVVYSIGKDRVDNGGACDAERMEPDIAFEFKPQP